MSAAMDRKVEPGLKANQMKFKGMKATLFALLCWLYFLNNIREEPITINWIQQGQNFWILVGLCIFVVVLVYAFLRDAIAGYFDHAIDCMSIAEGSIDPTVIHQGWIYTRKARIYAWIQSFFAQIVFWVIWVVGLMGLAQITMGPMKINPDATLINKVISGFLPILITGIAWIAFLKRPASKSAPATPQEIFRGMLWQMVGERFDMQRRIWRDVTRHMKPVLAAHLADQVNKHGFQAFDDWLSLPVRAMSELPADVAQALQGIESLKVSQVGRNDVLIAGEYPDGTFGVVGTAIRRLPAMFKKRLSQPHQAIDEVSQTEAAGIGVKNG